MSEIKLILSAKRIPVTYDAFETCWFLDLKYGNRLTDITNGSYDHCLEQKRHWQSVIDRGEIEALIPSCCPPQNTMREQPRKYTFLTGLGDGDESEVIHVEATETEIQLFLQYVRAQPGGRAVVYLGHPECPVKDNLQPLDW